MRWMLAAAIVALFWGASEAPAADCAADFKTRVAAGDECLVIGVYGAPAAKTTMVVFIHGDGSRGGASDYLFPTAETYGAPGVVAVGLIRPGYYDSSDNRSTGESYRREGDGYKPHIVDAVAAALRNLKSHFGAARVVLAGHSGGAAISGVIMGKYPGLADAAVLAACPCNVPEWRVLRRGRNNWTESLSPHDFIDGIAEGAEIVAITGGGDRNTGPILAREYVEAVTARGIKARFIKLPDVSHNGAARSDAFKDAVRRLVAGDS